jgi:hypothetical protein
MPRVLNIKRDVPNFKPGWSFQRDGLPPGAVYIGRKMWRLPESKWGNPFVFGTHGNREEVIDHFKRWLYATPEKRAEIIAKFKLRRTLYDGSGPLINDIHELRGLDLVCWCAPQPCHGHVLLRLANA